ncbi:alanine racemase [Nocardioides massiliensis]|uniref:Alanine racemase n=2 Tax=Nocardioides massiliensis TaxID=1325935 RepID=A0ABT9NLY2_9ACTN|nr:alanine racemase [Nocardioides massiliensis]MDP9821341.1 alanine racemase [Nocardioides massiliensis]
MLSLYVDGERWRSHLRTTYDALPGIVPVAKGNGYGFGLGRLARRAGWLGADTLAVGTYGELAEVSSRFDGDLLVLTPWRPFVDEQYGDAVRDRRVIHTVGRLEDLQALMARGDRPRVVLERLTSMLRHGLSARDLRTAVAAWAEHGGCRLEGVSLHLPLAQGSHLSEVERLMTDVVAAGMPAKRVWVSHLDDTELAALRAAYPDFEIRPRVGTRLWLGDRDALSVRATVLDAHAVERGDEYGYRGRTAPRNGTILVVSGGTAHGIGLEAPTGPSDLRSRAASLAKGGLDAAGFVRSPYLIDSKQRLFAEPPHMQASMLFLPAGSRVPDIGEEVDVRVRFTATSFDRTVVS